MVDKAINQMKDSREKHILTSYILIKFDLKYRWKNKMYEKYLFISVPVTQL